MTTKSKWISLATLATVFILAVAVAAQAGPHGRGKWRGDGPRQDCGEVGPPMHKGFGPHHMGMRGKGARLGRLLDLTGAQRTDIKAIRTKYRDQMKELRTELRNLKGKVEELVRAGNHEAAFDASTELRKRMFVLRGEMMSEIKGVLTPEQIEKLEKGKERAKERRERRFKNRHRPTE